MKRFSLVLSVLLTACTVAPRPAQSQERGAAALGDLVAGLGTSARVLVIAAHPDDEDTRLIAWLARGRHVETAYLSLTRGDGGQNLIGNELGEALGVIRTEELLAARRIDGASQYFTRAYDFGFSKTAEETWAHWPHDTLLGDVVKVVRAFKPQVIVAVFSGTPSDGHGHHQASGILAREAYDVAGDTVRFPAARYGAAWTPSKFYRTRTYWRHEGATYRYNSGEYSPLYGRSYAEIAALSRSRHRSQGFGAVLPKGAQAGSLRREASRVNEATPAEQEKGIFDGIDTTYARLAGAVPAAALKELAAAIAAARTATDLASPEKMVAPLARVLRAVDATALLAPVTPVVATMTAGATASSGGDGQPRASLDAQRSLATVQDRASRALALAAGVEVDAIAEREVIGVGDSAKVTITAYNRGRSPIRIPMAELRMARRVLVMGTDPADSTDGLAAPDSSIRFVASIRVQGTSSPWWLAQGRVGDVFALPSSAEPESWDDTPAAAHLVGVIAGANVRLWVPVVYRYADPARGEVRHPLVAAPAVSITLDRTAEYAPANAPLDRSVRVSLRSDGTAPRDVSVSLALPNGLTADSATRSVSLAAFDATAVTFRVRGRLLVGRHAIRATATSGGQTFATGYVPIEYEHIRPQRLYRDATIDVQAVDVKTPAGLTVAYLPGVGDNSAPALQQLGLDVTVLDPSAIATADFSKYRTVVVGPRFFEAHAELKHANARLLDYARRGGTVVVQYGQYEMAEPGMLPLPVTYSRPADRVTVEGAPVKVLDPSSPLLASPNRITDADFAGWIQDRSLYMPRTFDQRYASPLETHDPGEPENAGALLVAPVGRGTYVYTTLAFFRQLPNGVPGAARLFVNLLSATPAAARKPTGVPVSSLPDHTTGTRAGTRNEE